MKIRQSSREKPPTLCFIMVISFNSDLYKSLCSHFLFSFKICLFVTKNIYIYIHISIASSQIFVIMSIDTKCNSVYYSCVTQFKTPFFMAMLGLFRCKNEIKVTKHIGALNGNYILWHFNFLPSFNDCICFLLLFMVGFFYFLFIFDQTC